MVTGVISPQGSYKANSIALLLALDSLPQLVKDNPIYQPGKTSIASLSEDNAANPAVGDP